MRKLDARHNKETDKQTSNLIFIKNCYIKKKGSLRNTKNKEQLCAPSQRGSNSSLDKLILLSV